MDKTLTVHVVRVGKPIELSDQPESACKEFAADTKSKSKEEGVEMESLGFSA